MPNPPARPRSRKWIAGIGCAVLLACGLGGGTIGVPRVSGVDQVCIGRRSRQVVDHEGTDCGDRALAGADLVECSPYHRARYALVLMIRFDFGMPEGVPVGPQVGVVEPADQLAAAVELEAALIEVVDQLLGYRHLFFAAHWLVPSQW